MKIKVCAVYDKACAAYLRPIFVAEIAQAQRVFVDEALSEKTAISRHPEDFAIFLLGEFDDSTGELIPTDPMKIIDGHVALSQHRSKQLDFAQKSVSTPDED
jgi:hypothetical protein